MPHFREAGPPAAVDVGAVVGGTVVVAVVVVVEVEVVDVELGASVVVVVDAEAAGGAAPGVVMETHAEPFQCKIEIAGFSVWPSPRPGPALPATLAQPTAHALERDDAATPERLPLSRDRGQVKMPTAAHTKPTL